MNKVNTEDIIIMVVVTTLTVVTFVSIFWN